MMQHLQTQEQMNQWYEGVGIDTDGGMVAQAWDALLFFNAIRHNDHEGPVYLVERYTVNPDDDVNSLGELAHRFEKSKSLPFAGAWVFTDRIAALGYYCGLQCERIALRTEGGP